MSDKNKFKLVIAGNATLDAHIDGKVYEDGNNITVVSDGVKKIFEVVDGPIRYGYKHRTKADVEHSIRGLWNMLKPGGGGYNTATSIKRRMDIATKLDLSYVDVSSPDELVLQSLREVGISPYFFGLRPIPINAILGGREDKIILKGPMLPRVNLLEEHKVAIDDIVREANGVAINSAKDEGLVEAMIESTNRRMVPLYFVVTSSLPPDFIFQKMLPYGLSIISHEDVTSIHGKNPLEFKDAQLFEMSLEYLRKMNKDKITNGNPLFITLGANGVLCMNHESGIYHVKLKEEYVEMIGYSAGTKIGSTNGAGDVFAGAVVVLGATRKKLDITKVAMRASKASIRHIGYDGPVGYDSFTVKPFK
ncbi:hypothetical protein J4234_02465 [Candidatus Woesearchaeota archaeon]|nr:hypothetical protein [Candidatus Woesearchaeota archaeon]